MKHLFVPYELALKLKEKGFNEECLARWFCANNEKPILLLNTTLTKEDKDSDILTSALFINKFKIGLERNIL